MANKKFTVPKGAKVYETTGAGRKYCPTCDNIIASAANVCPVCSHEFPKRAVGTRSKKSSGIVLTADIAKALRSTIQFLAKFENNQELATDTLHTVKTYVDSVGGWEAAFQNFLFFFHLHYYIILIAS